MSESGVFKRVRNWVTGRGRSRSVAVGLFAFGVVLVGLSLLPGDTGADDAWRRDVLMTIGASFALFAPFLFLSRSLERHLDDVESKVDEAKAETDQKVSNLAATSKRDLDNLAQSLDTLRGDVDQTLSDVTARVTARLEAEAAADRKAFGALRHNASRAVVVDALERAHKLGLVSDLQPPRVSISRQADLYASVEFTPGEEWDDNPLRVRVETQSGGVLEWIEWPQDKEAEEVLFDVGIALRKHTNENFDSAPFLGGLADLLEAALSHADRRAAIQLCPPQWMVCDWGVVRYDGQNTYGYATSRLRKERGIPAHIAEKAWADLDSWEEAYTAALALYPEPGPDPWSAASNMPIP